MHKKEWINLFTFLSIISIHTYIDTDVRIAQWLCAAFREWVLRMINKINSETIFFLFSKPFTAYLIIEKKMSV